MYTITPRELSCYCPIWHIPSITAVPRSHSITPVPSCSVIASVQDKRLICLFSAVEPILPRAFNRPVLAPSLYVPNSRHQRSLLPGDVSIRGRQSSVASRRRKKKKKKRKTGKTKKKKGSSRQDTNPIKLFLYWLLGAGNKQ